MSIKRVKELLEMKGRSDSEVLELMPLISGESLLAAIALSEAVDKLTDLYLGATLDVVRKANEQFKKEVSSD